MVDTVVNLFDDHLLFPHVYPSLLRLCGGGERLSSYLIRDTWPAQALSSFLTMLLGAAAAYFILSSLSYLIFFVILKDKYYPSGTPQPYVGQVWNEMKLALISMPFMAALTVPIIVAELQGCSRVYQQIDDYGWLYFVFSMCWFLVFTDSCIYWIHRWLHTFPFLYKWIHKPHHWWKVPTPYAALAFHPIDGWSQSLPYHFFVFLFPMHKYAYLFMFLFVQLWTISIHDGVHLSPTSLINGSAHHTLHHSKFKYNYGQFFTVWDRYCGTHKSPLEQSSAENRVAIEDPDDVAIAKAAMSGGGGVDISAAAASAAKKTM